MGKYMRKAKTTAEVAVMEVSQSSLGVRTRAKTLALQRLQKSGAAAAAAVAAATAVASDSSPASSGSYLQLRSRRLEKPPTHAGSHEARRQKQLNQSSPKEGCMQNPNPNSSPNLSSRANSRLKSVNSGSGGSVSVGDLKKDCAAEEGAEVGAGVEESREIDNNYDLGIEASLGENVLEFEGRERTTRESTPCSLIRDPDLIRTPGSTTRPTNSYQRTENTTRRVVPTANEMDEFFSGVEEQQRRLFIEKYNFDPVNDKPLPGRFQWEKFDP